MKLKNFIKLFIFIVLMSNFARAEHVVENIDKYQISLDQKVIDAAGGFYPSIGSGLEFNQKLGLLGKGVIFIKTCSLKYGFMV